MKITPQDIIDKEFRVKFRGFDMVEVDTFLEEVAENFFKLLEENTVLNEEVAALREGAGTAGGGATQGQFEFPAELENFLEELKQDTAVINAELASLKQDRSAFASLGKKLAEAVDALQGAATLQQDAGQADIPSDLKTVLQDFTKGTEAVNSELAALKEERQSFDQLKKNVEQALALFKETGQAPPPQGSTDTGDLAKALSDLRQDSKNLTSELAAIKQEVGAIQQFHEGTRKDLQGMLKSLFEDFEAKFSQGLPAAAPPVPGAIKPGPAKKSEKLKAAIIEEEPEEEPEDTRLSDYDESDEADDDALEFLSEDDILDVERLRGVFQSVLDEAISDGHSSREGDDETSSDLLFLDDSLIELEPEPAVIFSLDESDSGKKTEKQKKS